MSSLSMLPTAETPKPLRTIPEVQKDYAVLLQRAGELQYLISVNQKDLATLNEQIRELNFEAAKINAANAKAENKEVKS